jgi:tetratricopeptide (TPR) repeat protein
MKYRLFTALFIILLIFLSACRKEPYPVLEHEPVSNVSVYEDHSEVLVDWLKNGYRNMIVVNVDYHDDLRYVPDRKLKTLKLLADGQQWDEISMRRDRGAESLYTVADFLYPAYRLGIIKKLYWVSPSRLLEAPDIEKGAREFLRAFGYPEEVIKTFRKDGQAVKGKIFGLDVVISSIRNLPKIKEPVLFTVDVDYFSNAALKKNIGGLEVVRDFLVYLWGKRIKVRHVSIAYSVNGGYADIVYRHAGDEVRYAFEHPEMINEGTIPPLWRLREAGYGLLRNEQYEHALKAFDDALNVYHEEPALLSGKAITLAFLEKHNEAFNVLEKLVSVAPVYDYTYIYIGNKLGEKGDVENAEKYFKKYLQRRPDSYYGLMAYADFLYNSARDEEALNFYLKVLSLGEYVKAVMYAGDALFHLGRFDEAMRYYERGLKLLDEVGYHSLRDFPESVRNINIIRAHPKKLQKG